MNSFCFDTMWPVRKFLILKNIFTWYIFMLTKNERCEDKREKYAVNCRKVCFVCKTEQWFFDGHIYVTYWWKYAHIYAHVCVSWKLICMSTFLHIHTYLWTHMHFAKRIFMSSFLHIFHAYLGKNMRLAKCIYAHKYVWICMCAYICVFKNAYMYHICMHIPYIFFQNMYIYADMYIFLKICKICVFARGKICTYTLLLGQIHQSNDNNVPRDVPRDVFGRISF